MSTPPFLALPDGVTTRTLTCSRGSFAALEAVPANASQAPVALLVPGFTGSKEDFVAILEPIASAAVRAVTYDQRGQYETSEPVPPEGWTLDAFAADLIAVAEEVGGGQPVHVLGHSFGGLVARQAVLAAPEAFASLVLLDSGPSAVDDRQSELLVRMADGLDAFGLAMVWQVVQERERALGVEPPADPRVAAFLKARFLANDPGCLAAMARVLASVGDRSDELAALALPKLVAWGDAEDAWGPEIQRRTASRIGAATVSFPEAAHSPAAESPKATAEAVVAFWVGAAAAG